VQRDPVLDGAFDAIVTMDTSGTIAAMNLAAERMFGYASEEAIGRDLADLLVPEEHRKQHRQGLLRLRDDPRAFETSRVIGHRLEMTAMRRGGERFPIELSVSRVDQHSRVLFTAWIRDLTSQRAAEAALRLSEAQLRQAQKMEAVGRLAGGVAHDFNNVLTAIFGYADLLLDGLPADDRRREDVEEIKRAANRAAALTRQLLAFSRKQVMQPRRLILNETIDSIRKLLAKLVGDDIELHVEMDPDLGHVVADPGQLEQVLMNLAANARDAMPEGGRLTMRTSNVELRPEDITGLAGIRPGSFVLLVVSDTGLGVPEDARPHIFEPFFTTKAQGEGTGLGLATVYGIVKQSGGWIYLDEAPGPGASFRLYLPTSSL
jgi:two-component system cell cycle sensor histidine kinase/response regulator CckA